MKNIILPIIIALIVIGGFVFILKKADNGQTKDVQIASGSLPDYRVTGNPEAKVTLAEYSDFQCPACATWASYLGKIIEQNKDSLRFEYHHFPLPQHQFAKPAAYAAEAAGRQGQYWPMSDLIFQSQPEWTEGVGFDKTAEKLAKQLNLNFDQFKKDYKSQEVKNIVEVDLNNSQEIDISATPTFFLNNEIVQPNSPEELSNLIKEAIDSVQRNQDNSN